MNTKQTNIGRNAVVVGAGIGGIAAAIRLAAKGYRVEVFEKNSYAGGKLGEWRVAGYRFDTGPSLFTMPQFVTELYELCGEQADQHFEYIQLHEVCRYFYPDGVVINAFANHNEFVTELSRKTGEPESNINRYLQHCADIYDLTAEVFLYRSFHRWRNFFTREFWRGVLHINKLQVTTTMHRANEKFFTSPRLVQMFDRYATYNGSNPYQAPATLNVISHLEHNIGAFFPRQGMYSIIESLVALAQRQGVVFHFNMPVTNISVVNNRVQGVQTDGGFTQASVVVSDIDIVPLYKHLLTDIKPPQNLTKHERSTSALIFYWAINRTFDQLQVHNILFSGNYAAEFEHLFVQKTMYHDPTVYIFISSKVVKTDAPDGCENWFVMVNTPYNNGQDWDALIVRTHDNIVKKIKTMLDIDIEQYIAHEKIASPISIEADTASYRGALYGNSSNSRFAAFNRHPNFRHDVSGMYFVGGSVHPGGGIPLCLSSAKIAVSEL